MLDKGSDADGSSVQHCHANPAVQSKHAAASTLIDTTDTMQKKTQYAVKRNFAGSHLISKINLMTDMYSQRQWPLLVYGSGARKKLNVRKTTIDPM